jgi:hypothetical protein
MVLFTMVVIIGVPMVVQVLAGVFDVDGIFKWGWTMYAH